MKKNLASKLLPVLLLFCFFTGWGQTPHTTHIIHFQPGQYKLSPSNAGKLINLLDSVRNNEVLTIEIEGNTDNTGGRGMNHLLSEKRANTVKIFLVKSGIEESSIIVTARGFDNPIATNKTKKGRQQNRRVEIRFTQSEKALPVLAKEIPDISQLYSLVEPPPQVFCIYADKDTVIRCKQGTLIYIKANSLIPLSNCGTSCIRFNVKEALLTSDMLLNNLTTTSGNAILETQGMIYTEAIDCNGNKLQLQNGKDMVIVMPTDSVNPGAKIFDGKRTEDNMINWIPDSSSVLSNFVLDQAARCGHRMCGYVAGVVTCKPCAFFFCRIGRVGKVTRAIFNNRQRQLNKDFRDCQVRLKKLKDSTQGTIPVNLTGVRTRPAVDSKLLPKCQRLEDLFKKYGVDNVEALMLAINKPLLDSFKISTLEQLSDTLNKLNNSRIELSYLNNKISYEDYNYYIFNRSQLGWANVDCFSLLAESQKTSIKIDLVPEKNMDCKLVFRNRRVLLPPTKIDNKYEFRGIPKGEEAYIVAIKYTEGRPLLAIRQINTARGSYDIEFKELSLEELQKELRKLD
jgi:hypothetical protein